jgi:hypothetical protein
LLLPSAQRFISAVEEKVKVEVREMGALTGPPTPWRLPSPAWMACVWAPSGRGVDFPLPGFALLDFLDDAVGIVAPFCAWAGDAAKRQIGELADAIRARGRHRHA